MLPFDDTLHVHQAGTVRSDNVFGSGSHVVFHLITPHADGDCLLFHGKHSAKPQHSSYGWARKLRCLRPDRADHAIYCNKGYLTRWERKSTVHAPHDSYCGCWLYEESVREFWKVSRHRNELTNIINLSRPDKHVLQLSKIPDDSLSQMPHNWRKGRRCNRIPETDRQNGVPISSIHLQNRHLPSVVRNKSDPTDNRHLLPNFSIVYTMPPHIGINSIDITRNK